MRLDAARSQIDEFALSSSPAAIARSARGDVVMLHLDQDLQLDPILLTATGYVTLLSDDLGSACVDARLDLSRENMPQATVVGDSIFAVEQAIVGSQARTFVRHYVIDRSTCDWIPTSWTRQ